MRHLEDSYVKEFDAHVIDIQDGRFVLLDSTYFYPVGGGQPHDEGILLAPDGKESNVLFVKKVDGGVSHEVERSITLGSTVRGIIDWDRRYKLMRAHTAAHILSAVIHKETGAVITGNQLALDKVRIDFSLDAFDPAAFSQYIEFANRIVEKAVPVQTRTISREEADRYPAISRLAAGLSPSIREVRIVAIVGFDEQACGGTHVRSTAEIGRMRLLKCENKGKRNRRVSFVLD